MGKRILDTWHWATIPDCDRVIVRRLMFDDRPNEIFEYAGLSYTRDELWVISKPIGDPLETLRDES